MFLEIASQAFEAGVFLNIFLRLLGFWGSLSYKDISYRKNLYLVKYLVRTLCFLKARFQVWDNFWQLKPFTNDEKCFFYSPQKLFSFLLFWLFGHVVKRLDQKDKVNFKFHDVKVWLTNNRNTDIAQYFEK